MKIGFDVSDLCTNRADGTTRYTAELAKKLPYATPQAEWHYFGPCQNIEAGIWNSESENSKVHYHASPWPRFWTQTRLPWDLYRFRPDVLFMPIQQIPFIRPGNMKTVAVVHDLAFHVYPEQFTYKDWLLQHVFTAYAARTADRIIAVSQATADDILRYYGRKENVHVVHHGVNHSVFRPVEERHPQLNGPYLLYVGQIQPRKNLIRLVQAFEQLSDSDLQLVIAGSHGWLQKPILERIAKSSANKRIVMLGRVGDELLPALYSHAEAFVLPSLYEGFGMPILEAMACGCSVVTSNVSCMPEVAGGAAILVDPNSVSSIAQGIQQARSQRKELRQKGLQQAQKFTWERTVRETVSVLV